jgi:hypothetical protein
MYAMFCRFSHEIDCINEAYWHIRDEWLKFTNFAQNSIQWH